MKNQKPFIAIRTAFHGGGIISEHSSERAAEKAARKYRRSGCSCGCARAMTREEYAKLPGSGQQWAATQFTR